MSGCPVSPPQGAHKLLKDLARIQRPLGLSQEYVSNQLTWNVNLAKFLDAPGGFFPNKGGCCPGTVDKPSLTSQQALGKGQASLGHVICFSFHLACWPQPPTLLPPLSPLIYRSVYLQTKSGHCISPSSDVSMCPSPPTDLCCPTTDTVPRLKCMFPLLYNPPHWCIELNMHILGVVFVCSKGWPESMEFSSTFLSVSIQYCA